MKIPVIVEEDDGAFGASSPEYPGVFAFGASVEEALSGFREGLEELFKLIREEGAAPPAPKLTVTTIEIDGVA